LVEVYKPTLKALKITGAIVLASALMWMLLRYYALSSYPLIRGGNSYSPDRAMTARALAILDVSFFGKEHRYYRFELVDGDSSGRVLRTVTVEALPGEEFRMFRGQPAVPSKWNEDASAVTFFGQGIELTLRK
jgi:hypothetical protein